MSSSILNLLLPINTLNNVAEKTTLKLNKLGIHKIIDMLFYFPKNIVVRNFCNTVSELKLNESCVIKLTTISHKISNRTLQATCVDSSGETINIVYFNAYNKYLLNYLPLNEEVVVIGTPEIYKNQLMINHPEKIVKTKLYDSINKIESIYTAYQDISSYKFKSYIQESLKILEAVQVDEWLDSAFVKKDNLPSFKEAIFNIHNPTSLNDIALDGNNRVRLAMDEILAYHLALLDFRSNKVKKTQISIKSDNSLIKPFMKILPFNLTEDQISVVKDLKEIMKQDDQITALIQGDVGSGKTIVCFILMLFALESNYQVAFLAPTEILAQQHYNNFMYYANHLGITSAFLKGKESAKKKRELLEKLANNEISVLIGTHAILQDSVKFHNLGLIIVDEQHRFGVNQRLQLAEKGENPHLILTTATPIPRTLALALYGDISTFNIKHKPKNRKEIITKTISNNRLDDVLESISRMLNKKEKAFWVCPLIDESEKLNFANTTMRQQWLKDHFPNYDIYLVHGGLKSNEKENILQEFKENKNGAVLVSTTVIEVGIDIPDCNIMIIENAEKFGLAQLHQLRGRVGRGDGQGMCLLIFDPTINFTAKKRLSIMKKSNDGFYIAEEDLAIRGFGDILGTSQSGFEYFKVVNLDVHKNLLLPTIKHAKFLIDKATKEDGTKNMVESLLQLFNKLDKDKYLKNG